MHYPFLRISRQKKELRAPGLVLSAHKKIIKSHYLVFERQKKRELRAPGLVFSAHKKIIKSHYLVFKRQKKRELLAPFLVLQRLSYSSSFTADSSDASDKS